MHPLLKKLNYKEQSVALVLYAPENVRPLLVEMSTQGQMLESVPEEKADFALIFVTEQQQINQLIAQLDEKLLGDCTLWFAYPKSSSKKYSCNFNRDNGWAALGKHGFEGVRQVSIDEDWTALRFRRVEFIKKMTRRESFALSDAGKNKTKNSK
ncbi:MAG: hypothetical protein ACLFUB_07645 [Cyclobacteriaceae bacterium]